LCESHLIINIPSDQLPLTNTRLPGFSATTYFATPDNAELPTCSNVIL